MKKRIFLFSLILTLPILVIASPECKHYPFLKNGFDLNAYKNCHELIQQCPHKGPLPDFSCAKKIAKHNKSCLQLDKLSRVIKGNPSSISAEAVENFILITQNFLADGQNSYYLISPRDCLVNTKIDPRNLSAALRKKYKNIPFIITNWDKPVFKAQADGTQNFTVTLRVNKTCLACDEIGWAKIQFIFDKNGKLKNINLDKFSKERE